MNKNLISLFCFFVIASVPAQQDRLYTLRNTSKTKGRMWQDLSTTVIYGVSKQFDSPWVKGGLYAAVGVAIVEGGGQLPAA